MQVNKWGYNAWIFLHCISFNYPLEPSDSEINNHLSFLEQIQMILPCKYCRDSYGKYLNYIPLKDFIKDRYGLVYWLFIIHNLINIKLSKDVITLEECIIKYESCRAKCGKITNDNNKEILTCQRALSKNGPPKDDIKEFINEVNTKYKKLMDQYLIKLFQDHEKDYF